MKEIVTGDCVRKMGELPEGCASIVFADPPFNIGYEYDSYRDNKSRADYLAWSNRWINAAARLVKPGGSMWVAIGSEYVAELKARLDETGLEFRNWIVWTYTFGVHCEGKFSRCHTHILYYIKPGTPHIWHPERVKLVSTRMEIGDKRAAQDGKTPPDVWTDSRVCGTFNERVKKVKGETAHPCQMPESILRRIVLVASEPGELVVDPFGGSGTTAAAAKKAGRDYWTCELSPVYANVIRERLESPAVFDDEDATDADTLARELGIL